MNTPEEQGLTVVVGASSAIAQAYIAHVADRYPHAPVVALSRQSAPAELLGKSPTLQWQQCDYEAQSLQQMINDAAASHAPIIRVAIFNGLLHDDVIQPEKRIEQLNAEAMLRSYTVNAMIPMLALQAVTPHLPRRERSAIAVLSARTGSIGDNRLGGWYSYRAAKSALNMLLKSAAIELARRKPGAQLIAFHPGTTDSALSRPFQDGVPAEKLFTPAFVAQRLDQVMSTADSGGTLAYLDWDNKAIEW